MARTGIFWVLNLVTHFRATLTIGSLGPEF